MATRKSTIRGTAEATIDHEDIRAWVEAHGGHPSVVAKTRGGKNSGILRIDFPGYSGEKSLQEISWDEFFARFDQAKLAFLRQDETSTGRRSNFNKLVKRETARSSAKTAARPSARTAARTSKSKATRKTKKTSTRGRAAARS